ncbi:hypothetical protein F5B22DRAFT_503505 [Xylaria bambusicola]|uniref:uncharacterized protein n=1 Tax=Xylaria bambusicola TaxID=326684 RepID=UPI00200799E8|nr:uncharacterized protein F5B22DRAFT_503505 [Xylaria bambusicola]KAI0521820.1 hypothetical protein F5B22DRAFT_503505 [Xylaria bambusicola]
MSGFNEEHGYPTTNTTITSYYQHSTTTPTPLLTTLTTIIISKTATIILTTVEIVTSTSTLAAPVATHAPSLSSTDASLPPAKITGIVLGVLFGILLLVFILYLHLMPGSLWPWRGLGDPKNPDQNRYPVSIDKFPSPPELQTPTSLKSSSKKSSNKSDSKKEKKKKKESSESPEKPRPTSSVTAPGQAQYGFEELEMIHELEGDSGGETADERYKARSQRRPQ